MALWVTLLANLTTNLFFQSEVYQPKLGIFFSRPSALGPMCRPLAPRPLGPLNFIVTVFRNRLVWLGWGIKILHKNVVIFKNTTHIINRRIFRALFVQGTFFTEPFVISSSGIMASINTTNIKVCMFITWPY